MVNGEQAIESAIWTGPVTAPVTAAFEVKVVIRVGNWLSFGGYGREPVTVPYTRQMRAIISTLLLSIYAIVSLSPLTPVTRVKS